MDLLNSSKDFFSSLCKSINEDANREGLQGTPQRLAELYLHLLDGYDKSPKQALGSVFNTSGYDEMIVLKKLPFYCLCEHHLLPFFGFISLGYIPNEYIAGLSGLSKLVEIFTHRLQIQENLTAQIADVLQAELSPKGVMVVCEARHLCMEMRGTQKNPLIITSALRGLYKKDSKTRAEFMQLING